MKHSTILLTGAALLSACGSKQNKNSDRPNILWIILDDTGCDFSCYGNKLINTSVADSLAAKGILFTQMHVTAPVSSACRSAMVTGMYQTSNGTHQHRSSRGKLKIFLDDDKETIPQLFRNEGYYTANTGYDYAAKTDYNFIWNPEMYDTLFRIEENNWVSPWKFRKESQPFFIQIQLEGGKNRRVSKRYPVDAAKCKPAPYYPDDSLFYKDESSYHSSTLHADKLIGDIMKHLHEEGLDNNTVVMILGDNGQDNYHDKQWLYDGGTRVPFIVYGPEKYIGKGGVIRNDLAIHIDMTPASMNIAGIKPPAYLEGKDILSKEYIEREFIVTARDRCDWTKDRIRAVRSKEFKYIRNFHPEYSYMQSQYRDQWPMVIRAKELYKTGKLNEAQAAFFQPTRPAEEFYILKEDPFEISNQINNPAYKDQIGKMRKHLEEWIKSNGDKGEIEESEESYREACSNVNTYDNKDFPLIAGISSLTVANGKASAIICIKNNTTQKLDVQYSIEPTTGLKDFSGNESLNLKSGEEGIYSLEADYNTISNKDSLIIRIKTTYRYNSKSEHEYKSIFVVKPLPQLHVPKASVSVDGKMGDWMRLPYYSFGKGSLVQFGTAFNKDYVYVGVQVFDRNIVADKNLNPWDQDGIEIRFDARKDPQRSCSIGTEDFMDHLLFAMSPSENGIPASFYLPAQAFIINSECFFREEIKMKCRRNDLGYATEIAIPVKYLNNLQDGSWQAFRMNIIVHNANGIEEKRFSWQPEWSKKGDYIGSGTFYK